MNTLEFCEKYRLFNYTINSDGSIDVNGGVDLWNNLGSMEKLPIKFGNVSGNFDCGYNKLTTLEGCPSYVGGYFWCDILTYHVLGSNVQGNIYYNKNKQRIVI